MLRSLVVPAILLVVNHQAVAQEPMSAQELHDRLVAVIERVAVRPVPAGDTLVSWFRGPVLYTTVARTREHVSSSLVRNDSVVGTAEATWAEDSLRTMDVLWSRGDSVTLSFRAVVYDGTIDVRREGTHSIWDVPSGRWAIADYGMEDQLLPLLESLPEDRDERLAIYRPFAAKWDTVGVTVAPAEQARVVTITAADGERFRWIISPKGVIVRITRDRHPESERRPLELTSPFADYLRLRSLGEF
jgi:hypothetical protein